MSTIIIIKLIERLPALLQRISHYFTNLLQGIDEARQSAHRYQLLSQLTDVELAARGIKREDIPQAVLKALG